MALRLSPGVVSRFAHLNRDTQTQTFTSGQHFQIKITLVGGGGTGVIRVRIVCYVMLYTIKFHTNVQNGNRKCTANIL